MKEEDRTVLDKGDEDIVLHRNIEGRIFGLFQSSDAD